MMLSLPYSTQDEIEKNSPQAAPTVENDPIRLFDGGEANEEGKEQVHLTFPSGSTSLGTTSVLPSSTLPASSSSSLDSLPSSGLAHLSSNSTSTDAFTAASFGFSGPVASGVLIDTSGYASDCNFSDLMPQHAMKPLRFMATMELIKALRIVEKANDSPPNDLHPRFFEKESWKEKEKCTTHISKDGASYHVSPSFAASRSASSLERSNNCEDTPINCKQDSAQRSEQKTPSTKGEKKCVEFRDEERFPVNKAVREGTLVMDASDPSHESTGNNSSLRSSREGAKSSSSFFSVDSPPGIKRERDDDDESNRVNSKENKNRDETSFSVSLSNAVMKEETATKEENDDEKSSIQPHTEPRVSATTSSTFASVPLLSLASIPPEGGASKTVRRRSHVGIKMPKKTSRRRRTAPSSSAASLSTTPLPVALSSTPAPSSAAKSQENDASAHFALPNENTSGTISRTPSLSKFVKVFAHAPPSSSSSPSRKEDFSTSILYRIIVPPLLSLKELEKVHALPYLGNLSLHNTASWNWVPQNSRAYFSVDCPPVEGIMEHSLATASGTLMGAVLLNARRTTLAIHWGGGMHHTKCGECSGFCYVNDIVLGITELLRAHERVLYIDLDAHHGDGVDEAFCQSNRVFTLSLHKFGDGFFPGTGHPRDTGFGEGLHYTMNLSLWDGINDFFYVSIFSAALKAIVANFHPDAIVLQCGADSLAGDRLGTFNLSSWGHGTCVQRVKETGLPLLVLGGGGYTIRNVAKLWAYETAILFSSNGDESGSSSIVVPLHTRIPVESMPLSGWLFVDQPQLLVAADASHRVTAGWQVQRGYRAVLDQIESAMNKLRVVEEVRKKTKVDGEKMK